MPGTSFVPGAPPAICLLSCSAVIETSWLSAANRTPSGPKASGPRCLKVGPEPEVAVDTAPVSGPDVASANAVTSSSFRDMRFTFSPYRSGYLGRCGVRGGHRPTSHTAAGATGSQQGSRCADALK